MSADTPEERYRPDRIDPDRPDLRTFVGKRLEFIGYPGLDTFDHLISARVVVTEVKYLHSMDCLVFVVDPNLGHNAHWAPSFFKLVDPTEKKGTSLCVCPLRVLMMTGCKCGGV